MTIYSLLVLVRERIDVSRRPGGWSGVGVGGRRKGGYWLVSLLLALVAAFGIGLHAVYAADPTFAQAVRFGRSEITISVAVGDLNGDGFLDIVQGNELQSYIYLNDGQEHFTSSPLGNGEDTSSVAVGDLNGDGFLDIVQSNYGQSYVYLNDGQGHFTSSPLDNDESTRSMAVGDLNGDGFLDIVRGNSGQSYVYLNDGQGRFTSSPLGNGEDTSSVAVGDLNGDGLLDIVQGNTDRQSYVYLNDGQGHFTSSQLGNGEVTRSVAVGDLNGDGFLDIVQGNSFGRSHVYLNDGQGHFTSSPLGNSEDTRSVAVGDLNGDGFLDIVQGNYYQQSYVYLNDGHGHFTSSPLGNSVNTRSVAVGDLNGDGFLDIVQGNTDRQSYVYLNDGQGHFTSSQLGNGEVTRSVAVGDLNGDGLLDIIQGNYDQNYVYLNDGQGHFTSSPLGNGEFTSSVAVGDLNGDGLLDIVQGNELQSYVYLNDGQGHFTSSQLGNGEVAYSVAVGDLNGDGFLDIVQGNQRQSYVYLNDGQEHFTSSPLANGEFTISIAVGDLNGDGFLDIVQGNAVHQSYVYLNDGQGHFTSSPLDNDENTYSVAVGDLNGDGFLDIVRGNNGQSYVYLNDGQGHFTSSPLGNGEVTRSVAVGDLNGDGLLDIVQGNTDRQSYVYLNDGQGHFTSSQLGNGEDTSSVAVGDLNGDGLLDIIQGNPYHQSYVYLSGLRQVTSLTNHAPLLTVTRPITTGNANFFSSPALLSNPTIPITYTLFDREGDSVGRVAAFYSPDGGGKWLPTVATQATITQNLRTGRVVAGALTVSNAIPATGGAPLQAKLTITPSIVVTDVAVWLTITHTNNADLAIALQSPQGTQVPLVAAGQALGQNFQGTRFSALADTTILSSTAPYTGTYRPTGDLAALKGATSNGVWTLVISNTGATTGTLAAWGLQLTSAPARHVYTWDTFASGFFGQSDNVVLRLVAYPQPPPTTTPITGTYRYTNTVAGPYQWPYASATTFPFRVRGTQVRVLQEGQPQANALVYRLPVGQSKGALPLANPNNLTPFRTDSRGYLQGRGQIAISDTLIALAPMSLPPTLTAHYSDTLRFYLTNAAPGVPGQEGYRVTQAGVQTLTVSSQHPLLLFDLAVALEWDARKDTQYLSQLEFNLKRTSELLYTWSHGQAALGQVTVYHDAPNYPSVNNWQPWQDAHIRLYASNRLRPNAAQGGIISDTLTEVGARGPITYTTGQVRMGAIWNRYGEAGSNLVEDWPRALAHELGHFLFFLEDNYLGLNDQGLLISVATCPGVMNDPYSDAIREFHPFDGWLSNCAQTLSHQETKRADWQTMQRFYPMLYAPGGPITKTVPPPPNGLPLAVTQVTFHAPITPAQTLDLSLFTLIDNGAAATPSNNARVILYQGDQLIDLGRPTQDQVQAYGVRAGDELCVYDWDAARLGCETVRTGDNQLTLTPSGAWQPDIIVTPVTSVTLQVTVTGVGGLAANEVLYARFFPLDDPATAPIMLTGSADRYIGIFALPQPTLGGFIRVWVGAATDANLKAAPLRDQITDFSLGGNPVPTAQKKRPVAKKRKKAPLLSPDGEVTLYGASLTFAPGEFYALQATSAITPPVWASVVGQAYRLIASRQAPALANASLSFDYLGQAVPAGEEKFLHIYFWETKPNACDMQPVPCWRLLSTNLDLSHNVASAAVQGPGLYALMSSIELPLHGTGWNNVGYPVQNTQPVTTALQSIAGQYSVVWHYAANATSAEEPWQFYAPNAPAWVSDLDTFEFGQGYWLYITATQGITLYVKGADDVSAATTAAAPNLPAVYYGVVSPSATLAPSAGMTLTAWIDGIACGQTQTKAEADQIVYVVRVAADNGSVPPVCGLLHESIVIFTLDGQPLTTGAALVDWDNTQVQAVPLQAVAPDALDDDPEPPQPDMTHFLFLPLIGNER